MTESPFWCKKCQTLYENKCTCKMSEEETKAPERIFISIANSVYLSKSEKRSIACYVSNYFDDGKDEYILKSTADEQIAELKEELEAARNQLFHTGRD